MLLFIRILFIWDTGTGQSGSCKCAWAVQVRLNQRMFNSIFNWEFLFKVCFHICSSHCFFFVWRPLDYALNRHNFLNVCLISKILSSYCSASKDEQNGTKQHALILVFTTFVSISAYHSEIAKCINGNIPLKWCHSAVAVSFLPYMDFSQYPPYTMWPLSVSTHQTCTDTLMVNTDRQCSTNVSVLLYW